jgi:hypothetical protein
MLIDYFSQGSNGKLRFPLTVLTKIDINIIFIIYIKKKVCNSNCETMKSSVYEYFKNGFKNGSD